MVSFLFLFETGNKTVWAFGSKELDFLMRTDTSRQSSAVTARFDDAFSMFHREATVTIRLIMDAIIVKQRSLQSAYPLFVD